MVPAYLPGKKEKAPANVMSTHFSLHPHPSSFLCSLSTAPFLAPRPSSVKLTPSSTFNTLTASAVLSQEHHHRPWSLAAQFPTGRCSRNRPSSWSSDGLNLNHLCPSSKVHTWIQWHAEGQGSCVCNTHVRLMLVQEALGNQLQGTARQGRKGPSLSSYTADAAGRPTL